MRMTVSRILLYPAIAVLLAQAATPARAQGPAAFQSPSNNIACQFFTTDDKRNVLRCDIREMTTNPRRPADCDLEWGHAFELSSKGSGTRLCYGDTVLDKSLPVLAYGEVWQRGGFTCTSEQSGITCFNADRHGFSLSRAKQEVF
jgi:hypothetical protein